MLQQFRRTEEFAIVNANPDTDTATAYEAPAWARAMRRFTDYLVIDFQGGPRPWKFAWVINFQVAGAVRTLVRGTGGHGDSGSVA